MNVASQAVLTTEPVTSEGVVAAGAYVDGRRVANIAVEDAASWRSRPGHVVWIGLHEPDMALLEQRAAAIPAARSRDRGRRPSPPAAEDRTIWRRAVHRRAHRAARRRASRSAKPICSSAKDTSCRSVTARRRPIRRCASAAKAARGLSPAARITSSTRSSISSSTITRRCSKPFRKKSRRSRRRCWRAR